MSRFLWFTVYKNLSDVLMTVHIFSAQYNTEQFW